MNQYIGTKVINAKPMNRLDYNIFRGWELPADEDGSDEGYLVEYVDGGKPNTSEYKGYVSWSPAEQFDNAYKASGELSFGDAIAYMKLGHKVARKGWNGKGMFLELQTPTINSKMTVPYPFFTIPNCEEGTRCIPYASTIIDIMSDDWCVVNEY